MNNNSKYNSGMTLVETIVAITVLLSVSTVAITVISDSIRTKRVAQDYSVSTVLAAEGIELVRQVRDTNRILFEELGGGYSWTDNIPNQCLNGASNRCYVDPTVGPRDSNRLRFCGGSCPVLLLDDNIGYQYSQGSPTGFTRTIGFVVSGGGSDVMEVTSTVSWQDQSGADREVVVRENLFDWE